MNIHLGRSIFPSAILPIYRKGKFEGWVQLIEATDDEVLTYIQTDESPVIINQRWLVKWIDLRDPDTFQSLFIKWVLTPSNRITQSILHGVIYRNIHFSFGELWEHWDQNNYKQSKESEQIEKLSDDFGGMF